MQASVTTKAPTPLPEPHQVVVELRGTPKKGWIWRIVHRGATVARAEDPYAGAEEAFAAGQRELQRLHERRLAKLGGRETDFQH